MIVKIQFSGFQINDFCCFVINLYRAPYNSFTIGRGDRGQLHFHFQTFYLLIVTKTPAKVYISFVVLFQKNVIEKFWEKVFICIIILHFSSRLSRVVPSPQLFHIKRFASFRERYYRDSVFQNVGHQNIVNHWLADYSTILNILTVDICQPYDFFLN